MQPGRSTKQEPTWRIVCDTVQQESPALQTGEDVNDLLSMVIERYESGGENQIFFEEADDIPKDIALLSTLMSQHGLTGCDFPEIGSKSMVSKVLNEGRSLSREAIERLCARF